MKYEDFKAVCKWLQTEQVSLDLNEDEIKQEYSLFKDSNKAINYTRCCTEFADGKCKPMVNADWTYLRCECGKRFEPKG